MTADYDLIGIGIGPFNLSLAALLNQTPNVRSHFFEKKPQFSWHSEIIFNDSVMQTSFLKDLVTPVDPTNPHSYLNYLVEHGLFYAHLNTSRFQVTRREFEKYCQWVSGRLKNQLSFSSAVEEVSYQNGLFEITADNRKFSSKNICVATGLTPWIPDYARPLLSETCLHAKSQALANLDLTGKKVAIIGGGQTGLEIFRNAFQGHWGNPERVCLISRRQTLEPLDETPFTNEYFTPGYVRDFYAIQADAKAKIVNHQQMASDGNTPFYLQDLYNELYQLQHVREKNLKLKILPQREVMNIEKGEGFYRLGIFNFFTNQNEHMNADVIILCTGFRNLIPPCLEPLKDLIPLDPQNRFVMKEDFCLDWQHASSNNIYAMNFSCHGHGIAEPQTSLMAWRSAKIINHLLNSDVYPAVSAVENFTQPGAFHED